MKNFEFIGEINKRPIIFINTLEDVYFLYSEIFEFFSKTYGNTFEIIVDLFLRNGFSFNRFIRIIFDGKENPKLEIVNPLDVSDNIKLDIRNYLKKNIELLEKATIEKSVKDYMLYR